MRGSILRHPASPSPASPPARPPGRVAAARPSAAAVAAALAASVAAGPAAAQGAPPAPPRGALAETFGPWALTCATDRMTDRSDCRMRHRDWVEPPVEGVAGLALEVQDRGGRLVPVVAARDLTLEGAARGLLALAGTVQLRFPPGRLLALPCALEDRSVVCAPTAADAPRAAAELPGAGTALVRVTGLAGLLGEPPDPEPVELALAATPAALARFRAAAPEPAEPPRPLLAPGGGPDLWEVVGRLRRLLGL